MDNNEEMKYEALAALIGTHHEENKTRINDLKEFMGERFNQLDAHNTRQNGSIAKAITRVEALERESQERKLTCMKAVRVLEDRSEKDEHEDRTLKQSLRWIVNNKKKTLILFIVFVLTTVLAVHYLDKYELIYKLINSIL